MKIETIGKRIGLLRELAGLTQSELAKNLNISRTSVSLLEQGKRNITAIELKKLSSIMHFSIDELLSDEFDIKNLNVKNIGKKKSSERISTAKLNTTKYSEVLLYVMEKTIGFTYFNDEFLIGLLYLMDFNFYELHEEHLTTESYIKLNGMPIPSHLKNLLNTLQEKGMIQKVKMQNKKSFIKYIPLQSSQLENLSAIELETINYVLNFTRFWTHKKLIDYCKNDFPVIATKDGQKIDFELVFYRNKEYSQRTYESGI